MGSDLHHSVHQWLVILSLIVSSRWVASLIDGIVLLPLGIFLCYKTHWQLSHIDGVVCVMRCVLRLSLNVVLVNNVEIDVMDHLLLLLRILFCIWSLNWSETASCSFLMSRYINRILSILNLLSSTSLTLARRNSLALFIVVAACLITSHIVVSGCISALSTVVSRWQECSWISFTSTFILSVVKSIVFCSISSASSCIGDSGDCSSLCSIAVLSFDGFHCWII